MSDAEEKLKAALQESSATFLLREVMRQEIAGGMDEAIARLASTDEGKELCRELGALLFQGAREAAKAEAKELVFDTWWGLAKRSLQIALLVMFFLPVFGKTTGFELAWRIIVGGVAK